MTTVMKITDISMIVVMMTTFLITTTISRTQVLQGQAQVKENKQRKMGERTDGYQKGRNSEPMMVVMMEMLWTKATERHRLPTRCHD